MFKFESKVKDLHKFTKKINNFNTFIVKCWDASIIKTIAINDTTNTESSIGVFGRLYIKSKVRFTDNVTSLVELKNKILLKARMVDSTNTSTSLLCYTAKNKKLSVYENTMLSELPTTLMEFCFDFDKETWEEVQSTYATWGDVKTNVSTWGSLMS